MVYPLLELCSHTYIHTYINTYIYNIYIIYINISIYMYI